MVLWQAYTAKLSDFGLAKLGPSASQSHVTTRVMGTYGYAAPEYVATGNPLGLQLVSAGHLFYGPAHCLHLEQSGSKPFPHESYFNTLLMTLTFS